MWRMQDGDRVMKDAEWALFRVGLEMLCDFVEDDSDEDAGLSETGVRVFDVLQPAQKLALLADVATALRDPAIPPPRHTAANEGAVAAVFAVIGQALEQEIAFSDDEKADSMEIRELLLAAAADSDDQPDDLPALADDDPKEWGLVLEAVEERIFWDRDYEMGDEFLDLPPEEAAKLRAQMTIDPEYFTAVPREPDDAGIVAVRQTLAILLERPAPDEEGLYPAFMDHYHDLVIGPCAPEKIDAWAEHAWIEVCYFTEPLWECEYETWLAEFSDAVPSVPFDLTANACSDISSIGGKEVRFEQLGDAWVVRDERGEFWCDALSNCWTDRTDDEGVVLMFSSQAEARAAYLVADQMYAERAARRRAALARLDPTADTD